MILTTGPDLTPTGNGIPGLPHIPVPLAADTDHAACRRDALPLRRFLLSRLPGSSRLRPGLHPAPFTLHTLQRSLKAKVSGFKMLIFANGARVILKYGFVLHFYCERIYNNVFQFTVILFLKRRPPTYYKTLPNFNATL